nr:hypothetical protein [Tanacetum cinerariifolium]
MTSKALPFSVIPRPHCHLLLLLLLQNLLMLLHQLQRYESEDSSGNEVNLDSADSPSDNDDSEDEGSKREVNGIQSSAENDSEMVNTENTDAANGGMASDVLDRVLKSKSVFKCRISRPSALLDLRIFLKVLSTLFNTGHYGSLEPSFACHFSRTKLILDSENSAIHLPTVNDDRVTNIAHPFTLPKGYILAFDGHSVYDRKQQRNDFSVPKDKLASTSTT